jgi:MinD superfamily P-loop ATPase
MKKKMNIAVASGKGGVGKSMLASSLAMLFVKENKIVAIDADVDAPNLHLWLGEDEKWDEIKKVSTNERPIIDLKKCIGCGQCVEICAFSALNLKKKKPVLNEYFCEGCGACEVICPAKAIKMKPIINGEIKIKKNVHGMPLVSAQLYPGQTGSGKIVDLIKEKAEGFDHEMLVIDSPAGIGCPVIAALNGVDFVVLVTEPTPSGFSDLKRVLTIVNHFKIPYQVVINKWDLNKKESAKIENWAKNKILGKISYDQKIFQAIASLTPIMDTSLPAKKEIETIYVKLRRVLE